REDHVSMGVHAADKLARIVDNVRNVLAIELLCAAQGVDLRAPHRPGPALDAVHATLRTRVAKLETDRVVSRDLEAVRALIDDGSLVATARRHIELE
ncbi:MAG: histidine ammonia-lyase, partial [bacterium]|nr:histidine ammonia-lyase [bacterium]